MPGLHRIALHNSYFTAKTVAIDCSGHTNNSGGNGAGKTTALSLIPVFYGEEPEKMVEKVADKVRFVEFYLPEHSSFIGFEYERKDGFCCAVLYRSRNGAVAYRFVKGSLRKTLFSDDLKDALQRAIPVAELFDALRAKDVEVSRQISTVKDYRAIIQNNMKLLRRSNKGTDSFATVAGEYCLGGRDSRMAHIDKLTYAILKRNNMFSRLKTMIAETMFNISIEDKPQHIKNEERLDDIASLRDFSRNEVLFRNAVESANERAHMLSQLQETGRALNQRREDVEALESQNREKCARAISVEDEAKVKYELNREELVNFRAEQRGKKEDVDHRFDALYKARDEWDEKDITAKGEAHQSLPVLRSNAEQAKDNFDHLKAEIQSIELERAEAINSANSHKDKVLNIISGEKSAIEQNRSQKQLLNASKIASIKTEMNTEIDKVREDSLEKERDLMKEIAELEAASKGRQPTEMENVEMVSADEAMRQGENFLEVRGGDYLEASGLSTKAKSTLDRANIEHDRLKKIVDQSKTARGKLVAQLNPRDGTLLAQLRAEDPEWRNTIGKVINPDLLFETSLSPEMSKQGSTLYGWSLNLDVLSISEAAQTEDYLRSALNEQDTKVRVVEERLDTCDTARSSLLSDCQSLKETARLKKFALEQAGKSLQVAKNQLRDLRVKHNSQQDKRCAKYKVFLSEASERYSQHKKDVDCRIMNVRHNFELAENEENALLATEISELDERTRIKNEAIVDAEHAYGQRIKDINEKYSDKCQKQGVDPATLKQAREAWEALKDRCIVVEGYQDDITRYTSWRKLEWSQASQLQNDSHQANTKISTLDAAISELELERKNDKFKAIETINELRSAIDTAIEKINIIKDCLRKAPEITAGSHNETGSVEFLVEKLGGLIEDDTKLKEDIVIAVDKAKTVIHQHPQSQISKAWERLVEVRNAQSFDGEFSEKFKLQQPLDLERLLDTDIPQIRSTLVESIRSIGGSVNNYYLSLRKLTSEVQTVSTRLLKSINDKQMIDELTDIRVVLTSRVESEDCWSPLVDFHSEWVQWEPSLEMEAGEPSLPPESLTRSLRTAIETLKLARISKEVDSLIDMHITMNENGRPLTIRSDRDLNNSSSNGLSYLGICVIFMGMCRYLCPDDSIQINWPVDELASLSPDNIAKLFKMLDEHNIFMFSAFPSTDTNLLKFFKNKNIIDRKTGVRVIDIETKSKKYILMAKLLATTNVVEEELGTDAV